MRGDYVRFGICLCDELAQMLKLPNGTTPSVSILHVGEQANVTSVKTWEWSAESGLLLVNSKNGDNVL